MPATVTLSSTSLVSPVGRSDGSVKVASTSGLFKGYRLWIDKELMEIVSLGVDSNVNVIRGVDGTNGAAHVSGSTVTFGRADQFYTKDPVGLPPLSIPVSPYINVLNGKVWFARGDALPEGNSNRFWVQQTTTYSTGPLGVLVTTYDPTTST